MGVSKFLGTFGNGLPTNHENMRLKCGGVTIDMNQFIHQSLEQMEESHSDATDARDGITIIRMNDKVKTQADTLHIFSQMCQQVLRKVMDELRQIVSLKDLYITMDGTPCYGKIQNQIDRRRKPKRYILKDGTFVLSSAFILPGTPVMKIFTDVLREELDSLKVDRPTLNMVLSLSDVPGEGEHKALDYLSSSPYTSFTTSGANDWFLIWSNDSDVIISLIHRPVTNVYVMTDFVSRVGGQFIKVTKCIDVSHFRQRLCDDNREIQNCPLLLMFEGNDYLPEMLNSFNIQGSYNKLRELCTLHLTKELPTEAVENATRAEIELRVEIEKNDEVLPSDRVSERQVPTAQNIASPATLSPAKPRSQRPISVQLYSHTRVINFEALRAFLRVMIDEEIQSYFADSSDPSARPATNSGPKMRRALQFAPTVSEYLANRVGFKREYYRMVYGYLQSIGIDGLVKNDPTDTDLYELEMRLALAYMKTYVWYYYYHSGYHVGVPLDNCYYPYVFPPLYSSLYILLERAEPEHMIQFDPSYNPALKPVRRELDYFEKLPSFIPLHHYIVLQEEELKLLWGDAPRLFTNSTFETEKRKFLLCDKVINRVGQQIEVSKKAPIELLVRLYKDKAFTVSGKVLTTGQVAQLNDRTRTTHKYGLRGMANLDL